MLSEINIHQKTANPYKSNQKDNRSLLGPCFRKALFLFEL